MGAHKLLPAYLGAMIGVVQPTKGFTWFQLVFDRDLLPRHIARLKSEDVTRPSPDELVSLLLNPITKGNHRLALMEYSINTVSRLMDGQSVQSSYLKSGEVVMNERGHKLIELAATVAIAFQYDLNKVSFLRTLSNVAV